MIRASDYKLNFLSDKFNLSQLHMRGVLQGNLLFETGWVWHFNGFDKTKRNQLMKDVWNTIKGNYVLKK